MKKRVNVYLDEQTVKDAKHYAVDNATTLAKVIEEALRKYLAEKK